MTISKEVREQVQQRANYACEFCGVRETDVGGTLTVDHYQPQSRGGGDNLENLIYACVCCNQYKQDYWSTDESLPKLWNPRSQQYNKHFLELEDGQLLALTTIGEFTCQRLRLNRSPLIAYRLQRRRQTEETRLLERYRDLVVLLTQLNAQLTILVTEQQALLKEQREILQALLRNQQDSF
jgi:HNH endonuclease